MAENQGLSLEPQTNDQARDFVMMVHNAGALPTAYYFDGKNKQKPNLDLGALAISVGQSLGFNAHNSLKGIVPVHGNLTIWGDAAKAICRPQIAEGPKVEWSGTPLSDNWICRVSYLRKGSSTWVVGEFCYKTARTAGLLSKPGAVWKDYAERMMFARANAFALRDGFADCLCGIGIKEEVEDYTVERQVIQTEDLLPVIDDAPEDLPDVTEIQETARATAENGRAALVEWYKTLSPNEKGALSVVQQELKEIAAAADARAQEEGGDR